MKGIAECTLEKGFEGHNQRPPQVINENISMLFHSFRVLTSTLWRSLETGLKVGLALAF